MSKELEALRLKHKELDELLGHLGNLWCQTKQVDVGSYETLKNYITQSLSTPTEEEVCKALSEYLEEKVWYQNGCFYIGTYNECEAVVYLFDDDVHFNVVLSPKIVVLIGRFYEGVIENDNRR